MKQAIIVRKDLKLPKGKLSVQVAHASVSVLFKYAKFKDKEINIIDTNSTIINWLSEGMPKIVLYANDINELTEIFTNAKIKNIMCSMITDAGKTVFNKPTITCASIGPDKDDIINSITKHLKLV